MQIFYINEGSTLPLLRMELVKDGKHDFYKSAKFNKMIQNADVTFTMWDEHETLRISKAPCEIVLSNEDGCEENYILQYRWKERDTRRKGQYKGRFTIDFKDDLYQEDESFPDGRLIVPIWEDLKIMVK